MPGVNIRPPVTGAPGHAGARILGQAGEEIAERLMKDYLGKDPATWMRAIVAGVAKYPELAVKLTGFSFGEVGREVIFRTLQGMGINTENDLVRSLADTPDNVFRGIVEAIAETARNGGPPPAPQATSTTNTASAIGSKVATSALVDGFVHLTDAGNESLVLCKIFFTAKQAWEKTQLSRGQPQNDQQQGGRGKGRGNQQQQPVGKFPQDLLTMDQAKRMGLDECPVCKPFTAAGIAAAQEASVPTATTAPAAAEPQPIPDWDEKVGSTGRWLARALDASVENSDDVDDKKFIPVLAWRDQALVISHEILKDRTDALKSGFDGGKFKPLTHEQLLALPNRLNDDQVERMVRFIFGEGAGQLRKGSQLKALIDSFSGKKKKAEEEKKAAEELAAKQKTLADAQAKLTAAGNPVETAQAKAEIAKAEKALEPPPTPEKSYAALYIGAGILMAAIWVIVTVIKL